jgi:uncharacterized protein YjiS (DUF1127 family)
MLPGSLEAGRHVLLVPRHAKFERVAAFLRMVRCIPHTVWPWFIRGKSRRTVAMLSDHMLRDIGLTRADVERELMKPFWRD